ncbi:MAG TPA: succinylglutamate desuccinylase/aspartoacylase family protein [Candidatus Megaira endosymbiont of Stentor roeselii]|nr:succinylglutamate desuccinylase/aspartoacylase family protein [Candidatus Megaera endosymbiont of Stentor roeselii]
MDTEKGFVINGVKIEKGQRKQLEIVIAKLYDHTDITIPVEVICGKESGPVMFVSGAIHGDEINGVESIKRLLSRKKILSSIKGTLIAVPIVNVFGFNRNVRYLPDRRDLNRTFPGFKNGSLAARIAHIFMKEIVTKCQYGIDLHTGSAHRFNLPQVRGCLENPEVEKLAKAFGVPVILNSNMRDGSLRQAAFEKGINILLFEGGEALRYDEKIISSAENGIIAVMCEIGMIEKKSVRSRLPKSREVFRAESSHWIRAPISGSLQVKKKIGNKVNKDQILRIISNPFGTEKTYVKAKKTGIIIGITMMPLVSNGDALFHVATFDNIRAVAEEVLYFEEELK